MPDAPSFILTDANPGVSKGSNDAMPIFGGHVNPGETVVVSVDGNVTGIGAGSGNWEFSAPELADGEHDFEVWVEDAQGNRSESVEWTDDVQADESTRREQRARNVAWQQGGAQAWVDSEYSRRGGQPLTPPRPITGGGGAQQVTDPVPGSGSGSSTGGGRTPTTGGTGAEDTAGGAQPAAAGFEKGNAGVGRVG